VSEHDNAERSKNLAIEIPNRFVALRLLTERAKELDQFVRNGCSIVDDMSAIVQLEEVEYNYPRLRELYGASPIALRAIDSFYGPPEVLAESRPWFVRRDGTSIDAVPAQLFQLIGALAVETVGQCQECRFWSWEFNPEEYGETEEVFWSTKFRDYAEQFKGARFCGLSAKVREAVRYANMPAGASVFTEGDGGALLTMPTHCCSDFRGR